MKLAAVYNFFNGEEHLVQSISSIRNEVDEICLVAQHKSNRFEKISTEALDVINDLKLSGLINDVIWYEPQLGRARQNELKKRILGKKWARKKGCTHFMLMDADEFYRSKELRDAKLFIEANEIRTTSVTSFFHIQSPQYRARDTTNVSLINQTSVNVWFSPKKYYIPNVDTTRRITSFPKRHYHFEPDQIAMYHMNFVRKQFDSKFNNTSTSDRNYLEKARAAIETYDGESFFDFPGKGRFQVEVVQNEFNTFCPYQ